MKKQVAKKVLTLSNNKLENKSMLMVKGGNPTTGKPITIKKEGE